MNEKDYNNYVNLAKKELKAVEGHQIRICEYAMKVCQIRHGGRSNGYYTITDFASDIGMESKTLSNWLLTYRNVVQKLDKPISTQKEWVAAKRVENVLREERIVKNRIADKPVGSSYASKIPVSKERIQNIYSRIESGEERPFEAEFAQMLRSAKHALSLLQKRELGIIDDDQLEYLMTVIDESSEILNNYVTKKRRSSGRKVG